MFIGPNMGDPPHLPVTQGQDEDGSRCISPAALQATDISRNPSNNPSNHLSPGSHQEWRSPTDGTTTDNVFSDLSEYTSPDFDDPLFLQPDLSYTGRLEDTQSFNWSDQHYQSHLQPTHDNGNMESLTSGGNPGAAASLDRQLLSPVMTDTPSPQTTEQNMHSGAPTVQNGHVNSPLSMASDREPGRRAPAAQLPTLNTGTFGDTLDVERPGSADLPPSPIVKVSSYTRGDSPSREDRMHHRESLKRSRNGHLAPTQDNSSSDSDGDDEASVSSGHRRTVSVPISALRSKEGSWLADSRTGQRGLDPSSRGDAYVLSPKEMMVRQQREEKNAEVEQWLCVSEANSEVEDNGGTRRFRSRVARRLSIKSRRRARSTGDPSMASRAGFASTLDFDDSAIPGPGALLDVDCGEADDDEEESEDSSEAVPESPPAQIDVGPESYLPSLERMDSAMGEHTTRVGPWHDTPRNRARDTQEQPHTANAAMMRFVRQAENVETASLAATVDTHDIESIFSKLRVDTDGQSIDTNSKKKSRRESILNFLHRNTAKRKFSYPTEQKHSMESIEKLKSNDTMTSSPSPSDWHRRKPSLSRPHPEINANSAVIAMTGQIAAVGGGSSGPVSAASPKGGSRPWSIGRSRSRSEIPKGLRPPGSGGLMELMTSVGGPPIPTLAASPMREKAPDFSPTTAAHRPVTADGEDDDDFDDDGAMDDKGVVMDLAVGTDLIVPSLDGFRTHVRQLNPRLQPALVERIAKEQTLRYKRLVDLKTKHANAVSQHACAAKQHCFHQGGTATYLTPRTSPKDPESTYGHFSINGSGAAEDRSGDGTVVSSFPAGIPLPPVSRLPAEFECSLCFKVRKFQKPSDWSKHVHEDLQPFTCTFPECTEPKSFKRKADWVRHENERHRHLEWWTCNFPECVHTCYRKDNFVQHLVREHKMPDPKNSSARSRSNKNSHAGLEDSTNEQSLEELWRRVDECNHPTEKKSGEEACRFCGNLCGTWKKLTVHMARHMEQIAMPVLELVKQVKVGGEFDTSSIATSTPISPYPVSNPSRPVSTSARPASQALIYNTGGLLTEAFAIPQAPLRPQRLQMQNALSGMPHRGAQMAAGAPSYAVPRYNQPYEQNQYSARANSATYPPPFNVMPRQQGRAQQPATYDLDTNAAVQTTRFAEQQHLFSSPVDNMSYAPYQHGGAEQGQQSSVPYAADSDMMGYPMVQGDGYIQPGQSQY